MSQERKWMTTGEFAQKTGLPAARISKLIRDGKIEAAKVSGRWRIDPGQLGVVSAKKPGPHSPAEKAKPAPKPRKSQNSYSIAEFAAMTYLTEKGVMGWLKSGRLKGRAGAGGEWTVDAANLESADISRLVRK